MYVILHQQKINFHKQTNSCNYHANTKNVTLRLTTMELATRPGIGHL